jgi:hypothetical protein
MCVHCGIRHEYDFYADEGPEEDELDSEEREEGELDSENDEDCDGPAAPASAKRPRSSDSPGAAADAQAAPLGTESTPAAEPLCQLRFVWMAQPPPLPEERTHNLAVATLMRAVPVMQSILGSTSTSLGYLNSVFKPTEPSPQAPPTVSTSASASVSAPAQADPNPTLLPTVFQVLSCEAWHVPRRLIKRTSWLSVSFFDID